MPAHRNGPVSSNVRPLKMTPQQLTFLEYEFTTSSLLAAFATRRKTHPVYAASATGMQKDEVKQWVRKHLLGLGEKYKYQNLSEGEHVAEIRRIKAEVSKRFPTALHEGKLRFGVAQKLVNLYVKYLCTVGAANSAHHCPLDGIVNKVAKLGYQWNTSDSELEYIEAISKLKSYAGGTSLPQWEIHAFQEARTEA